MMNIEELRALIGGRRSTRRYDESRSDEIVRTVLDCARWAPSGGNGQPWEFIVVREQAVRHHIADYYMKQMEQKREMDLAVHGKENVVAPSRRSLEEIIHCETYDMNKFRSDDQLAGFVKTRTLQGAYGRKGGAQGEP
jgi:nitroreductase